MTSRNPASGEDQRRASTAADTGARPPGAESPRDRHVPESRQSGWRERITAALAVRRSQGAPVAVLLVLLGLWSGFAPFVGPYFGFGSAVPDPADPSAFTMDRLWLNALPAAAVILGALMLGPSANRLVGGLGALLALAGGFWLIIGPPISRLWGAANPPTETGAPIGAASTPTLEQLGLFHGPGALIIALAAFTLGRFTVRRPEIDNGADPTAAPVRQTDDENSN